MGTSTLNSKLIQELKSIREAVLFEVFLDLHEEYDDLDWYIWLEVLAAYGVGQRKIRLLWTYWDRLTMVARAGRYFGLLFKGYRGVIEGNSLFPTLYNVVMDAVIRYWVTVVAPTKEVMEGLGL